MSRYFIGIDTSNYTTSAAVFDADKRKIISNVKRLLSVNEGERGLRQSDAVFAHVKNLPEVTMEAFGGIDAEAIAAVGVSSAPRDEEGSYMPCFLTGVAAASTLANGAKVPLYRFSHQAGHVMAAVWSGGRLDLLGREFIAFHVSGGTTEMLLVKPCESKAGFDIEKLGGTLDLNAGQAIDRVGVAMGLSFPAGPRLEELALANTKKLQRSGVCVKGCDCNLSGVENKAAALMAAGESPEYVAAYVLDHIGRTLIGLTKNALALKNVPVLYAGGVMSNSIIKDMIKKQGFEISFAEPKFSSDNAAGTALLTAAAHMGWDALT